MAFGYTLELAPSRDEDPSLADAVGITLNYESLEAVRAELESNPDSYETPREAIAIIAAADADAYREGEMTFREAFLEDYAPWAFADILSAAEAIDPNPFN